MQHWRVKTTCWTALWYSETLLLEHLINTVTSFRPHYMDFGSKKQQKENDPGLKTQSFSFLSLWKEVLLWGIQCNWAIVESFVTYLQAVFSKNLVNMTGFSWPSRGHVKEVPLYKIDEYKLACLTMLNAFSWKLRLSWVSDTLIQYQ